VGEERPRGGIGAIGGTLRVRILTTGLRRPGWGAFGPKAPLMSHFADQGLWIHPDSGALSGGPLGPLGMAPPLVL
jgi:hypothetical protein